MNSPAQVRAFVAFRHASRTSRHAFDVYEIKAEGLEYLGSDTMNYAGTRGECSEVWRVLGSLGIVPPEAVAASPYFETRPEEFKRVRIQFIR